MFARLLASEPRSHAARRRCHQSRLSFQFLEERTLFAGIPQLSSLPGAAHTLYLDFDGHFQATWNRTDSNQTYTNITVGEFNIDGAPGISSSEESAIRKIWETVADDYAAFNVNVTTVAPVSTTNMLRVVMAGTSTATLLNSLGTTQNIPSRDVFISNDNGTMVDTSGYAAVGSYTNAEPNVVFVFARYMSTWSSTDSEGHYRDLRAMIATTASHEAGHAYGLVHHGDYDVGDSTTTPIMGSNTQGDRTIWSLYTSGNTTYDSKARLTTLLGARADEHAGTLGGATEFPISYDPIYGQTGSVKGVISTTNDVDMFRFTVSATNTYQITVSVPQFGNLDAQLVLYVVRGTGFGPEYLEQVIAIDPAVSSSAPFSGLGATMSGSFAAGKYVLGVRSHGGYGDLGSFTLTVSIPSTRIFVDLATMTLAPETSTPTPKPPKSLPTTLNTRLSKAILGGGQGAGADLLRQQSLAQAIEETTRTKRDTRSAETKAHDDIFATWPALKPTWL